MIPFATLLLAYLLGSISSAIICCRLLDLPDPRKSGSGNPGATNVLRTGNRRAAIITLAGDVLKGLIPVLVARAFGLDGLFLALVGLAAFLGHLYPIFFGFRGGKGVATAAGAMLGLTWSAALLTLVTWLILARVFRISSLAALGSAVLAPGYFWLMGADLWQVIVMSAMSLLLIGRHRDNIARLRRGDESVMGRRSQR